MVIISAFFWFILCFLMAGLEIEAEGKYGWAEKMPTWYRTSGFLPGLYRRLMAGKVLTGYHSFMFFLPVGIVHAPFVSGVTWTLAGELNALSMFFVLCVLWDFLWFVFNPHYGMKRFKKKYIWWHAKSPWIFNLFPADYLGGMVFSTALAYASSRAAHDAEVFRTYVDMLGWLTSFTLLGILLAPRYHRWRTSMDVSDDRRNADIFHQE